MPPVRLAPPPHHSFSIKASMFVLSCIARTNDPKNSQAWGGDPADLIGRPQLFNRQATQKRTSRKVRVGSKTEVSELPRHFRFTPQSRHRPSRPRRPFRAKRRHRLAGNF